MKRFICVACGTQHEATPTPPEVCSICTDDRQHVSWDGQQWTTHEELAATKAARAEIDGDLLGIGVSPRFAIPQRALFAPTDAGNILWDCTSLITAEAVDALNQRGGVDVIIISHPHFYSSMVEWSDALGGVPILLHEADREWVRRSSPNIAHWTGDRHQLSSTVSLYRCPGHFPGSTLMHWTAGPAGKNLILSGDTLHVAGDRRHVTFMYSVPNYIPARLDLVEETQHRVARLPVDDIYGFTWGLNILGSARAALDASFDRYYNALGTGRSAG
jgi:glyoxylase-like metal-dependent hydrolase (beta-lactamase superfamily II)